MATPKSACKIEFTRNVLNKQRTRIRTRKKIKNKKSPKQKREDKVEKKRTKKRKHIGNKILNKRGEKRRKVLYSNNQGKTENRSKLSSSIEPH